MTKLRTAEDSKGLDKFAKDRADEANGGTSTNNTFVELGRTPEAETIEIEPAILEQSASVTSDIIDVTKLADGELTTTAPSLFEDDIRTPHAQEVDFFSTICNAVPDHI